MQVPPFFDGVPEVQNPGVPSAQEQVTSKEHVWSVIRDRDPVESHLVDTTLFHPEKPASSLSQPLVLRQEMVQAQATTFPMTLPHGIGQNHYWAFAKEHLESRVTSQGLCTKLIKDSQAIPSVGSGSNGVLSFVDFTDSRTQFSVSVAVKHSFETEIDVDPLTSADFCHDLFLEGQRSLLLDDCPFCCKTLYVHEVPGQTGHADYVVLERIRGGTIYERRKDLRLATVPFEIKMKWAFQAGTAVASINAKGFVHRDLKDDNVMLTDQDPLKAEVRLIDFGSLATIGPQPVSLDGNFPAMPPEVRTSSKWMFEEHLMFEKYDSAGFGWFLCALFGEAPKVEILQSLFEGRIAWKCVTPAAIRELFPQESRYDSLADIVFGLFDPRLESRLSVREAAVRFHALAMT